MPGTVRVGCSGWSYKDWRGTVYPSELPASRWFEHYRSMFDTVELNATHYRVPSEATVDDWATRATEGFVYAVKVHRFGTHRKHLRDPGAWLPRHVDPVRRLGSALGPNLVQLPPRWRRDVARLDDLLAAAPRDVRWAVELREPSWLHDDVLDCLHRHGAALCLHDLLPDHPLVLTTDWTYLRFHGPDALDAPYQGRYGRSRLRALTDHVLRWAGDGHDVYAYFNNDHEGAAVADATWLRRQVARRQAVGSRMTTGI